MVVRRQRVIVREAYRILPSVSKVNATIYEGRAHLSDTISKLNACTNEGVVRARCCIVGGLASAARNATEIAGDMASEDQQITLASSNIPIDVQSAVSSYINMVTAKLEGHRPKSGAMRQELSTVLTFRRLMSTKVDVPNR